MFGTDSTDASNVNDAIDKLSKHNCSGVRLPLDIRSGFEIAATTDALHRQAAERLAFPIVIDAVSPGTASVMLRIQPYPLFSEDEPSSVSESLSPTVPSRLQAIASMLAAKFWNSAPDILKEWHEHNGIFHYEIGETLEEKSPGRGFPRGPYSVVDYEAKSLQDDLGRTGSQSEMYVLRNVDDELERHFKVNVELHMKAANK